jgi:glycosyltransferase involved in cell wall biosynthesis
MKHSLRCPHFVQRQQREAPLLTVIIPVFNEERTLDEIIEKVLSVEPQNKEIIIVDDCSTDSSGDILEKWCTTYQLLVVSHEINCGKGAAIRTALEYAQGKYTIIQDADIEYDPHDYTRLLEPLIEGVADVVYGSRSLARNRENADRFFLNPFRICVSLLNLSVRLLYHQKITDEATCYKLFPTSILKVMRLECERFEFCPEVTAKAARMNLRFLEIPIHYTPRGIKEGKKIGIRDAMEAFQTLWRWRKWNPETIMNDPLCKEK